MDTPNKIPWSGTILSVQPRIRLTRSFDQREHSYLGYVLFLDGAVDVMQRRFSVVVGKAAHAKHEFKAGMFVEGSSQPVPDPRMEVAEF